MKLHASENTNNCTLLVYFISDNWLFCYWMRKFDLMALKQKNIHMPIHIIMYLMCPSMCSIYLVSK